MKKVPIWPYVNGQKLKEIYLHDKVSPRHYLGFDPRDFPETPHL